MIVFFAKIFRENNISAANPIVKRLKIKATIREKEIDEIFYLNLFIM
jgi:hypothetical protein